MLAPAQGQMEPLELDLEANKRRASNLKDLEEHALGPCDE